MTAAQRQAAAVAALIPLVPTRSHSQRCPSWKSSSFMPGPVLTSPKDCSCWILTGLKLAAAALDEAGLLCALKSSRKVKA